MFSFAQAGLLIDFTTDPIDAWYVAEHKFIHKEETQIHAGVTIYMSDHTSIRHALATYIDNLNAGQHLQGSIINIATGKLDSAKVNMDETVWCWQLQDTLFSRWMAKILIQKNLKTCASQKKKLLIGTILMIGQQAFMVE